MTDTLQAAPTAPLPMAVDDEDAGCGCCIRPPAAVSDKVAALEARRDAVDRRLRGLRGPAD